jgi:multiple sugar transport system ATP-binding protein
VTPQLELSRVVKAFGPLRVVHGVDLEVAPGEFCVLVGPSGCGKSTLLRMVAGLEGTTDGRIRIAGRDVTDLAPRDRNIAMVFQDYALYPHKSVFENIAFGLRVRKTAEDEVKRRVDEAAAILQIGHLLERRPANLSGGQRQRVAMGRAIVRDPQLFLFDEPLSNLDAQLRAEMRVEIGKLHERLGATILYVTHDQVEAMTLADRIVVLRGGHVMQIGAPEAIYHRPEHRFVAGFAGSPPMQFLPARIEDGGAAIALGDGAVRVTVPQERAPLCAQHAGRAVEFGIRPEHITPQPGGPYATAVAAQAVLVEPLGSDTLVLLRVAGHEITARFPPEARVSAGEWLTAHLAMDRFHLFDPESGAAIRGEHW